MDLIILGYNEWLMSKLSTDWELKSEDASITYDVPQCDPFGFEDLLSGVGSRDCAKSRNNLMFQRWKLSFSCYVHDVMCGQIGLDGLLFKCNRKQKAILDSDDDVTKVDQVGRLRHWKIQESEEDEDDKESVSSVNALVSLALAFVSIGT